MISYAEKILAPEDHVTKSKLTSAVLAIAAFAFVLAWSPSARAGLIYDLNCIVSQGCLNHTVVPSYGTVTFEDNASDAAKVDVTIELVGTNQLVHHFWFNYNDALFANDAFAFTGNVTDGIVSENGHKPDGYPKDTFDIQVPATGNFSGDPEPYTFTISLPSLDLDPGDFAFKDVLDNTFMVVHIGRCGPAEPAICEPGQIGDNSIHVGSLSPLISVLEPATLPLFGLGFAALVWMSRRLKLI